MKSHSVKKNLSFQLFYQLVVFLVPLIIAPYLTRTLGSKGLGDYSYINTFTSYAGLIANLGIASYGQRLIASHRDDNKALRKAFWSLFNLHLISSFVALFGYFFLSFVFAKSNRNMLFVQGIFVIAMVFDVTWLFYGLEDFKSVVLKNSAIKVLECVLIFTLIKQKNDIYLYALIMGGIALLGYLIMLPQAIRTVPPIKTSFEEAKTHIKPMLLLFTSVVAVTLYTVFDKTLIGFIVSKDAVAYYEYSAKIIEIPKQILNALGMVVLPRACYAFACGRVDEQKRYFDLSLIITCVLGSAFCFGLSSISYKFSIIYYGIEFAECGRVITMMSPMILIVLIGNVYRTVYIIPAKLDKQLTFCLLMSSLINIVLSLVFIPILGLYGAIVGTLCAELFGLLFQAIYCKRIFNPSSVFVHLIPFIFVGFVMYAFVSFLDSALDASVFSLLIEITFGVVIYTVLALLCLKLFFNKKLSSLVGILKTKKIKSI